MDVIANDAFIVAIDRHVAAMASEEDEAVIQGVGNRQYEIAFDPLGRLLQSRLHTCPQAPSLASLRTLRVRRLRAAVATSSSPPATPSAPQRSSCSHLGAVGRQWASRLIHRAASLCLPRPSIACPRARPVLLGERRPRARLAGGLAAVGADAKRGNVPSGTKFSARYVCALVADVHLRACCKVAGQANPRPHLRLLYQAAPLAHIVEASGGAASGGVKKTSSILSREVCDRVHLFLGSKSDVAELVAYGDVQQQKTVYQA